MTEFRKRRETLLQKIGETGAMILPAAPELLRNGDAFYPYRQQSDFYYVTGFSEPEAVAVLLPNRKEGEFVLFNRVRDRDRETWDGPRAGQEGAVREFLADQSYPFDELVNMLPELLAGRETLHYTLGINHKFDHVILKTLNAVRTKVRTGIKAPIAIRDVSSSIHEMRLFKDNHERQLMQRAIDMSGDGHIAAMKACKPGMFEYELEALFLYECQRQGARSVAYTPIVGAGKNTCILHYISNNQRINDGDLVLIDAGAEYENYAADITRTFPANGKFSKEQRAIYELVLASQLAAIQSIKPGVSYNKPQEIIVNVLTEGLIDLGILKGNLAQLIDEKAYLPFYMHRSGHWLGLDVHDVGCYTENTTWRAFQPGMALTVEPGIYISADIPNVDKKWHNIGVRIEDDIMVTASGCDVLSQMIPKTVEAIETLMQRKSYAV